MRNGVQTTKASRTRSRDSEKDREGGQGSLPLPACAECRRVKRRCNRKWPCQSCVRRGCASICPNGTLTPGGGGNRYILHGSEQLHRKIKEMSTRMGQLEDALAALWVGERDHPLLRGDLLNIKLPPDTQNAYDTDGSTSDPEERNIDEQILVPELDALAIGERGEKGRTERLGISTIEFILNSGEEKKEPLDHMRVPFVRDQSDGTKLPLAPSLIKIADAFPSSAPVDSMIDLSTLLIYLPPLPLAMRLAKSYFDNAGWTYGALNPQEFVQDTLGLFYPSSALNPGISNLLTPKVQRAHELALLYMVFSVGALVDLSQPPLTDQSERYHILAKTAVCLESPLVGASITLIQALSFMFTYSYMWEQKEVKLDRVAVLTTLVSKMGLTLGLHRDPPSGKMSPQEINRRRWIFWELLTDNAWQSLSSGRPPTIQIIHMDTQLPSDLGPQVTPIGTIVRHPHDIDKFRFARECLWPIIESNFNLTKRVNYAAVLALDRKVREFVYADDASVMSDNPTPGMRMQAHASEYVKEHVMLHLHRAFFSRAMVTNPDAPLDSPYASSFLAIFKCAVTLLESVKAIYEKLPSAVIPYGLSWTDVLMSAVAMGTICSKGPRGSFAPLAYNNLKMAVQLAESRFAQHPRAKTGLPMLHRLQNAAHQAISSVGPGPTISLSSLPNAQAPTSVDETNRGPVLSLNTHSMPAQLAFESNPQWPLISTPSPPSHPVDYSTIFSQSPLNHFSGINPLGGFESRSSNDFYRSNLDYTASPLMRPPLFHNVADDTGMITSSSPQFEASGASAHPTSFQPGSESSAASNITSGNNWEFERLFNTAYVNAFDGGVNSNAFDDWRVDYTMRDGSWPPVSQNSGQGLG